MGCIRLEKMTEYLIDPLRRRAIHLIEQKMLDPRPLCQELQRHGRLGSQNCDHLHCQALRHQPRAGGRSGSGLSVSLTVLNDREHLYLSLPRAFWTS